MRLINPGGQLQTQEMACEGRLQRAPMARSCRARQAVDKCLMVPSFKRLLALHNARTEPLLAVTDALGRPTVPLSGGDAALTRRKRKEPLRRGVDWRTSRDAGGVDVLKLMGRESKYSTLLPKGPMWVIAMLPTPSPQLKAHFE